MNNVGDTFKYNSKTFIIKKEKDDECFTKCAFNDLVGCGEVSQKYNCLKNDTYFEQVISDSSQNSEQVATTPLPTPKESILEASEGVPEASLYEFTRDGKKYIPVFSEIGCKNCVGFTNGILCDVLPGEINDQHCSGEFVWKEQKEKTVLEQQNSLPHVTFNHGVKMNTEEIKDPLKTQEGGNHYKAMKIQPVEYAYANNLGFAEANVLKYVTRHKVKNKAEDIRKAIHYLKLILKFEYGVEE